MRMMPRPRDMPGRNQSGVGRAGAGATGIDLHRLMLLMGSRDAASDAAGNHPQAMRQRAVATRQKSTARRFVSISVVGVMGTTVPFRLAICHMPSDC